MGTMLGSGVPVVLFVAVCLLQIPPVISDTNTSITFECPERFVRLGAECLLLVDVPMNNLDAEETCRSYGSSLVHIRDEVEAKNVGYLVHALQPSWELYWIGNLVHSEEEACSGFWDVGEPKDESVNSTIYVAATSQGRWREEPKEMRLPFLCKTDACVEGTFRCRNGEKCLSNDWKCDKVFDCHDKSDEDECASECTYYYRDATGMLDEFSGYSPNRICTWVIEGPPGHPLSIEFTDLDVEEDVDFVEVWSGSPSIVTSQLQARLTGELSTSRKVYGYNNFLIVRLVVDSSIQISGFRANWEPDDELSHRERPIVATDAWQELTSPYYGSERLPTAYIRQFTVTTDEGSLITMEVMENELGEDFHYDSDTLNKITGGNFQPATYVSMSNRFTFYLVSNGCDGPEKFRARVRKGCAADVTGSNGFILPPNFGDPVYYPPSVECQYLINAPEDNPQPFQILFTELALADSRDSIKVFDGSNSNATEVTPAAVDTISMSSSSSVLAVFKSSLVQSEGFFSLTFNLACPPITNDDHMMMSTTDVQYSSVVALSCDVSFAFEQEEYTEETEVIISCGMGGKWNVTRLPTCAEIYCGVPEAIDNGFIVDGSGTARYNATVTYSCFVGFEISGSNVSTCGDGSQWSDPPTCEATACGPAADLPNGNYTILNGNGTEYSSVVEYHCYGGYEEIGPVISVCQRDGTWFPSAPVCQRIKCPLPDIDTSVAMLNVMEPVEFEGSLTVNCTDGYVISGTNDTSKDYECPSSRDFGIMYSVCVDFDECQLVDTCTGDHQVCKNTVGTYICECEDKYRKNGTECEVINQCVEETSGCDLDNGYCMPLNDGEDYECGCNEGYLLFTENGTSGRVIPPTEDGITPGDVYRINHTCVPKTCGPPPMFSNGTVLTAKMSFDINDTVEYRCDFGLRMPDNSTSDILTCQGNDTWDKTPAECERISCGTLEATGLVRNIYPNSTYYANDEITLECYSESEERLYNKTLFCAYDIDLNTFRLQGDNPHCPAIDCGNVTDIGGSLFTAPSSTGLGASFVFGCQLGFEKEGISTTGDDEVICERNGRWGLGNLTCSGARCTDPGTPGGMTLTITNFEVDSTVYYTCDRAGFEANPSARTCTFNSTDNSTYWDGTQPVCEDVQDPEFTNCSSDTIKLKLYSNPRTEISIPEASDNSGLVKVTVSPPSFTSDMALDQGTYTVMFTASDAAGNSVTCNVTVEVDDPSTLPELSCPDYVSLDVNSTSYDVDLASEVSTDSDSTLSFSPGSIVSVTSGAVGKTVYRVTATNEYGFYRQCAFIVDIQPAVCLQDYIESDIASKNAEVTCDGADGGMLTCNVTCNDGYSFQDSSMTMSYSCQGMNEWTPRLPARTCVAVLDIAYEYEVDILYSVDGIIDIGNCELRNALEQQIPQQRVSCSGKPEDMTSFSVSRVVFRPATHLYNTYATIYLVSNSTSKCDDLLQNITATANLFDVSGTTFSCGSQNSYNIQKESQEFKGDTQVCYAGYLLVNGSSAKQCVPCEPGYYLDGEECRECGDGTYQDKPAQEMCKACPGNVQSYLPRVSESQCDASCPAGFYNDSSSSRCHACAEDSYQSTPFSSSCMNCSEGTTTSGVEGADECQAECGQGFYATNNTGCEPCPQGYYKSVTGNMACEPCGANETTANTGTISQTDCVPVPESITCYNGGDLTIDNHIAYCDCPDGYSGQTCLEEVDACLSSPCYNGGECSSSSPDSFSCECPKQGCRFEDIRLDHSPHYLYPRDDVTVDECKDQCMDDLLCIAFYADISAGTPYCVFYNDTAYVIGTRFSGFVKDCPDERLFEGKRCEIDAIDNCVNSTCYDPSFCRDLNHSAECVCPEDSKYRPPNCEPDEDLCASNPCDNSATCVSIGGGVRFTCICPPGFTGDHCQTDIDECEENPDGCLYGGSCQDLTNDYDCTCSNGYDGDHCEIMPDYCTEQNVCANGLCYNDYDASTAVCVCEFPYTIDGTGDVCEAIDVCSTNDPCEHNSSCIYEGPGMASCQCQPGYRGSLCQTDIDECSSNPCMKGKCVNQVNNFTCECEPGFEGVQCEKDIDGCLNHSCVENNYDVCQDLPLGYRCNCSAGFTGKNCELNIDECLSLPCQHNGSCTESSVPGEYNCTCVNGWTGTSCETPLDFCDPNPCNNSGSCFSLEDEFFCACEGGTFGKTCEVAAELCSILNPCTPESSCEEVDGNAQCACPMNYTGGSCNLIKDGCSDDPCGSNGTCILYEVGYSCKCAEGYSGAGCTEKADPCETVTCPYESTCTVEDEEAKCECMNKTNGVCKEMSTDFDIYFQRPDKQICSDKAFSLSESEMTIMVWVAPLQKTDDAIVELKLSDGTIVLAMDMENVTFGSESPEPMNLNSENRKYEVGTWNHMTVNWFSSGHYETYLSGFELTGGTTGADFPPLNTPISICIGGGFTGYISQLYVWQKSVTFDEILAMYSSPDTIKEDGLVERWGAYHLSENLWAELLFPSKVERSLSICAGGQTGSDCDNKPNKEPPSLQQECPDDQTFDDVERLVQITDAYLPGDALSSLPGTILTFGAHRVVYMALDDQMNVNFCRFNAYVKRLGQSCNNTEGLNPDNIVPCESEGQKVQCPAGSMAPMDPKILTCGKLGSYNLDNSHQLPPAIICGSVGSRKVMLTLTMVYEQNFPCAGNDEASLSTAVLNQIKILNSNWSNLCVNAACSNVDVLGKCVSANSEDVTVTVTFNSLPSTLTHAGVTLTPKELILTATKEMDTFNINYANGAELQTDTVMIEEEGMCDPGFGLKDGICVECAEGSFLNETTRMCQKCPIGSYTDQPRETSCALCSAGETTLQIGAHYCNISCDRGKYLDDDGQCKPCEKNFYQDQTGQIMCLSCPAGTATETTGADDASLCVDTCDPGTELKNQSCVPCPRGYFRDGVTEEQETCEECPMGNTTVGTGSTSHTLCNQAACDPGYSRNSTLNQCEVCDYGYFQPEKWQDSCEMCNESYTTNNTGSTSPDQCLFYCLAGEENLGGLSCTECERGFYRTASMEDRFVTCTPCNETFTTSGKGSMFAEDCNIRVCEAGSYRNETDNTCNLCPYGTYQPDSLATECFSCPDNTTTEENGRSNNSQCIFYCPSGYEVLSAENQTCRACDRGYFKTNDGNDVFDMCERCPDSNTTTDSEASTSDDLCIVPVCEAGQEVSGTGCVDCSEDKFQSVSMPKTTDTCKQCPDGKGTMEPKQTSNSTCEFFCGPGEQYDQQNSRCEPCPMGTWNTGNNSQRFEQCAECTPGYVTANEMTGANSSDLCTLRDCPAGEFIDDDDNCTACAVGYYQDVPRQTSCKGCPSNTNTTGGRHDEENDCTIYCPAGETQDPQTNDTCVLCEEDFFKDYAGYGDCNPCTGNFTSDSSRTDCSISFCDRGYEADNNGNCLPCEVGKYKDIRGNDVNCTSCPTNKTTSEQASTMQSQCDQAYCDLGFYSLDGSLPCLPCSVGYFKNTAGNDNCTKCDMDFTTEGVASTAESDCFVVVCPIGHFRNDSNQCESCPIGEYQDEVGQNTCKECDEGYNTTSVGSDSEDDCRIICDVGKFRNDTTNTCMNCPRGSYQNKTGQTECEGCGAQFTTAGEASTEEVACYIICRAGEYSSTRTDCEQCPHGQFQGSPGSSSCENCTLGNTTLQPGSQSADDCMPICDRGEYLDTGTKMCKLCDFGTFNPDAGTMTTAVESCQDCRTGNTTTFKGATDESQCNITDCGPGNYRANEGCELCDYGYYQPERSQMSCIQCPAGLTTLLKSRFENTSCVDTCPDGEEYDMESRVCKQCQIGYSRKAEKSEPSCRKCPLGKTTLTQGADACIDESSGTEPKPSKKIKVTVIVTFRIQTCGHQVQVGNAIINVCFAVLTRTARTYPGLCTSNCGNAAVSFNSGCLQGFVRQKRSTGSEQEVEVTVNDVYDEIQDNTTGFYYETDNVIARAFYEMQPEKDLLEANGLTFVRVNDVEVETLCQPGEERDGSSCSACEAGTYSTDGSACSMCEMDTYQNSTGQTHCLPCPALTFTADKGAVEVSNCTRKCQQPNARETYCSGHGVCMFDDTAADGVRCDCDDSYEGDDCEKRKESTDDKTAMIIGIACGSAAFLLLLLLIVGVVACLKRAANKGKKKQTNGTNGVSGYTNSLAYADDGVSERYVDYNYPLYDNGMRALPAGPAIMFMNPETSDQDVRDFYLPDKSSNPPSRTRSRSYESEWKDFEATM